MEKKDKDERGWGIKKLQVTDCKVDYVARVKVFLSDVIDSKHMTLELKKLTKLYKEMQALLKESMLELSETFKTDTDGVEKAENQINDSAGAVAAARKRIVSATRDKIFAAANFEAYEEANNIRGSLTDGMKDRLDKEIAQKDSDLQSSQKKLEDFTWRMYGPWQYMWENDVKLAQKNVDGLRRELVLLHARLEQHNNMTLQAVDKGGVDALLKAKFQEAEAMLTTEEAKLEEALTNLQSAEDNLAQKMSVLEGKAKLAGAATYQELMYLKHMHKTLAKDALVATSLSQVDIDPFDELKKEMGFILDSMLGEETVLGQSGVLSAFTKMVNCSDKSLQSDWMTLVGVYTDIDLEKFVELSTGGKIPNLTGR